MKKVAAILITLLLFTGLFVSCATAQAGSDIDTVIEVPNLNKDQLYIKANAFLVDLFSSSKSAIQFSDKEAGIIKGKYSSRLTDSGIKALSILAGSGYGGDSYVTSTFTVNVQDGRIRFLISKPDTALTKEQFAKYEQECLKMLDSFRSAMISEEIVW